MPNISREFEAGLVSVIIPTFNRANFLRETVLSIFAQNYRPIEILIVDDGSTDNTSEIVAALKLEESRDMIIRFLQQSNQGSAAARNYALLESNGEFIQFLDSDDLLEQEKISNQVSLLRQNENIDVIYGDWYQGQSKVSAKRLRGQFHNDLVWALLSNYWHPNFSYLYKREIVFKTGNWRQYPNDDFDFILRAALNGAVFYYKPEITGFYRWHPSPRLSRKNEAIVAENTYQILDNASQFMTEHHLLFYDRKEALANYYWRLAVGAYPIERKLFEKGLSRALELDQEFMPSNRCQRLLVRCCGYEKAAGFISHTKRIFHAMRSFVRQAGGRQLMQLIRLVVNFRNPK
jgi:glycosyltransferase involved in cell wall biosynthesis